jgi:prolipoprotein diacylglyceryltransferase
MIYALIRFMLDFLRLDSNGFGVITTAQLVSLSIFAVAFSTLLYRHRKRPAAAPAT